MSGANLIPDELLADLLAMLRWWRHLVTPAKRRDDRARRQPATRRVFELIDQLAMGGTADAYLCRWDSSGDSGAGEYATQTEQIEVADPLNKAWGLPGEKGVAEAVQADNGIVWRVVENPGHDWYWAELDGVLASGGSATASIHTGGTLTDTTENVTVYAPPVMSSGSIALGSSLRIAIAESGKWYPVGAPCA